MTILRLIVLLVCTAASMQGPHGMLAAPGNSWTVARLPTPGRGTSAWPFDAEAVSCPVVWACYIVGDTFVNWAGYPAIDTLDRGEWSTTGFSSVNNGIMQATVTNTVACPTATECVAAGSGGPGDNQADQFSFPYLLIRAQNRWKMTITTPMNGFIVDLSCSSTTFCVGAGYSYLCKGPTPDDDCTQEERLQTYTHGRWRSQPAPLARGQSSGTGGELWKISCPGEGRCVAIGGAPAVIVTLSNGHWHAQDAPVPPGSSGVQHEYLSDVACPTSGQCQIVGTYTTGEQASSLTHPLFLSQTGSGWNASTIPTGGYSALSPDRVSCPSVHLCAAAGTASSAGLASLAGFRMSGGTWSRVVLPYRKTNFGAWSSNISSIACATTQSCMAVGVAANAASSSANTKASAWSLVYHGGHWQAERIPDPAGVDQSSAPEIRDVAVTGGGYVAVGEFFGPYDSNRFPDGKGMVAFHG